MTALPGRNEMEAVEIVAVQSAVSARSTDALEDFIYDCVSTALAEWDVAIADVDTIVTASSDLIDGRAISMMVTGASCGAVGKDLMNLSSASEHALLYAAARILAGRARLALVAAWAKPSEVQVPAVENLTHDPFFVRAVPHESSALWSLEASALSRVPSGAVSQARSGRPQSEARDTCVVMLLAPVGSRAATARLLRTASAAGPYYDPWGWSWTLNHLADSFIAADELDRLILAEVAAPTSAHLTAVRGAFGIPERVGVNQSFDRNDDHSFAEGLFTAAITAGELDKASTGSLALAHASTGITGHMQTAFLLEAL